MNEIRVGIIGCGVIGPCHIESLQKLENVTIAKVCDIVEEKARQLAEKYNVAAFCTDADDVINDPEIDLVTICTDHASHYEIAEKAANAGKHIVCEKALATSFANIDKFIKLQKDHPELVFSGIFQHRFDPPMQLLKELVDNNEFGTILTASVQHRCVRTNDYYNADSWRGTWEKEGGSVLINQAIHFIDILAWVMGGVGAISGQYLNITHQGVIETEDTAVAALRFKSGALGTLEATCSSHINWENTIFIHGTEGSVELREGKPLKVIFTDEEKGKKYYELFDTCRDQRKIAAGANHYGFGHPAQFADVISAIREKRAPFVTVTSACHANEIALALHKSCNTGAWVELKTEI